MGLLTSLLALDCTPERASSPNWTPSPAEVAGSPVVVAAGDIAHCRSEGDEATAELLEGIDATIVTLGDNAYRNGSARDYQECYDPSWGRFKGRTRPAPGNHEYDTQGASAYFRYFGKAAGRPEEGYYSYELGAGTSSPSTATARRSPAAATLPRRRCAGLRQNWPTMAAPAPWPTSITRCSPPGSIAPESPT